MWECSLTMELWLERALVLIACDTKPFATLARKFLLYHVQKPWKIIITVPEECEWKKKKKQRNFFFFFFFLVLELFLFFGCSHNFRSL